MRIANLAAAALLLAAGCRPLLGPSPGDGGDGGGGQGLHGLGDEFEAAALHPRWTVLGAETFRLRLEGGALQMQPTQNVVWWQADRGPGLVQLVRGGVSVTARVRARRASDPSLPPGHDYQFGGLILRDPRSDRPGGAENYVFSVVGYRGSYLAAETKSTRDDRSDVAGPAWPSGDAELRICRLGAAFRLYDRPIVAGSGGGRWHHAVTYTRPDLPQELQAGPIAYAMSEHPDLRASFEWVRFAPAETEADCERE